MRNLLIVVVLMTMSGCFLPRLYSPRYSNEVENQVIPPDLLNSTWKVALVDGTPPSCDGSIVFGEKGRLSFLLEGQLHYDHYTHYVVKGDSIQLHTGKLYKVAWTKNNCAAAPDQLTFSFGFGRSLPINIRNDRWEILSPIDHKTQLVLVRSHQ